MIIGITLFLWIFVIPLAILIDKLRDRHKAIKRHQMFPFEYPDPRIKVKQKQPLFLSKEEKARIENENAERIRKQQEETARKRELYENIRSVVLEDYINTGDYVLMKRHCGYINGLQTEEGYQAQARSGYKVYRLPEGMSRTYGHNNMNPWYIRGCFVQFEDNDSQLYQVIKVGTRGDEETVDVFRPVDGIYEKKRNNVALCKNINNNDLTIAMFDDLKKCDIYGNIIYNDIKEWAESKRKRLDSVTNTRPRANPDDAVKRKEMLETAFGGKLYGKFPPKIDFGFGAQYIS